MEAAGVLLVEELIPAALSRILVEVEALLNSKASAFGSVATLLGHQSKFASAYYGSRSNTQPPKRRPKRLHARLNRS